MDKQKLGKIIFWVGVIYLFGMGWFGSWWINPMYRSTPPEVISQTVWALFGPLWWLHTFSPMVGALLAAIGMSLYAETKKSLMVIILSVLIVIGMLFPPGMGYHIWAFGAIGALISGLFVTIFWYWKKVRAALDDAAKHSIDYQFIGYIFFFAASISLCGLLGGPWYFDPGLYFPEKVLEAGALPFKYSQGIKIGIHLVLGFFFSFLSHLKMVQIKK